MDLDLGVGLSLQITLRKGHLIATHDDGAGKEEEIYETITTLIEYPAGSGDLRKIIYTNEDPATDPVEILLGEADGSKSVITNIITGNRIATHNNGSLNANNVDINETITDLSLSGSTLTYSREAEPPQVIELPDGLPTGTNGQILRNVSGVWTAVDVTEVTLSYCLGGTPTTGIFLKL